MPNRTRTRNRNRENSKIWLNPTPKPRFFLPDPNPIPDPRKVLEPQKCVLGENYAMRNLNHAKNSWRDEIFSNGTSGAISCFLLFCFFFWRTRLFTKYIKFSQKFEKMSLKTKGGFFHSHFPCEIQIFFENYPNYALSI